EFAEEVAVAERRDLLTLGGNRDLTVADDEERVAHHSFPDEPDAHPDFLHLEPCGDLCKLGLREGVEQRKQREVGWVSRHPGNLMRRRANPTRRSVGPGAPRYATTIAASSRAVAALPARHGFMADRQVTAWQLRPVPRRARLSHGG